MTRKEIARELMKRTGITAPQATQAVEGIIGILTEALAKNEPIALYGFGTIKTVQRAAKTARDINKGTTIMLPPRKDVKFIVHNKLKNIINNDECL